MAKDKFNIAVVGATGLVGRELIETLSSRRFPIAEIRMFSSWNTAGEKVAFQDDEFKVEPISGDFAKGQDLVFFATHPMVSRDLAEAAADAGAMVIDASRTFRLDPGVPLVVPEVNPRVLDGFEPGRIVASPSPATVALSLAAGPLHKRWGIKRMIAVAAFGSTHGGRAGFEEHQFQTISIFNQQKLTFEHFVRQAAFNVFPRVGEIDEEGYSEAEHDVMRELPRVLEAEIPAAMTAMQVPVFCGVAIALNVELSAKAELETVRSELANAPGLMVMDDPAMEEYPDSILAMENERVLIGRIRRDPTSPKSLQLWISADNLRKGSALNMVQIAEALVQREK